MRIIGGLFKSRKLHFPKTRAIRPVTDRAKETIFNVLGPICGKAVVLDLFAGSGSLGIEALSRGASEVCFVDSEKPAFSCIHKNIHELGLAEQSHVLQIPVLEAIRNLEKKGKKFNLIFLDPPHNKGLIKKVLHRLDRSDIVLPFSTVVVGRSNLEGLPQDLKTLYLQREIKIGQTFVNWLVKAGK